MIISHSDFKIQTLLVGFCKFNALVLYLVFNLKKNLNT